MFPTSRTVNLITPTSAKTTPNNRWIQLLAVVSAALLMFALSLQSAVAQDIFGRISGTVTDSTGAVVAQAKITVTSEETRVATIVSTNESGYYVASNLHVGLYSVSAEKKGYKVTTKTKNDLVAGGHLTVDLNLQVGDTSQSIEVTAIGETVNTTTGEVSKTIDSEQVKDLALNERNYAQLVSLIPGAALTSFDQTALTTGMSTTATSVNGLRADGNLFTVDGGYNMDSGSNATQLDNVGIDFVREVTIQTSNYSAEYGRNDGASVNVVTKSGGSAYHGSLFEYVRNNVFDAVNSGNKLNAAPGSTTKQLLSPLRYNDFGWDIGGPIFKKKLFFFAGQEWKLLRIAAAPQTMTLPTTAELSGNFSNSGINLVLPANAPAGCTITANVMSSQCITADGKAIANVYSLMEQQAAIFNNTDTSNNTTFQPNDPQNWREDIIRIDYQINDHQNMYFRYIHDNLNLIDAFGTFTPGGLPTTPTNRIRPGYSYQGAHVWTISSHLINEAKFNVSWNKQRIPPSGNTWERSTYGFQFPLPFPNAGTYPNGIPHVTFSNTGVTAFPTSAPAQFSGPYFSLLAPTTDISPSDNLTWQLHNHTLKFGAAYARNRKDQNSRPNSYNAAINFGTNAAGNNNSTGDPFADALMGNFQSFTQQSADPVGHFRFNDFETYVNDSWKVNHKLSLELGIRLEHTGPTYTQGNNLVNFDPSLYTSANAPTSLTGSSFNLPVGGLQDMGYVIDGLVRAGAVPGDQLGRLPNGMSAFVLAVPTGSQRGFYKPENLFAPRLGFSYSPFNDNKTVIRGGFGIFYDKPEGNVIFGQPGVVPFLQATQLNNANLANPTAGTAGATTIFGPSAVDPNFVVARTMQYSLGVQHELKYGFLLEANYVGNLGRHEVREPNINVPTFTTALAAAAGNAGVGVATNKERPYFGYTDISQFRSDGNSVYNALQISATKRKGDLNASFSYTYSHANGQTSGINDNPEPECPFSCLNSAGQVVSWRQFYYGPLSFDRHQIFVATYTYHIPFYRSQEGFAGKALGGWELSGITRAQTGQPLTITGSGTIGPSGSGVSSYTRRANIVSGVALYPYPTTCPAKAVCWFNPAAFTAPSNAYAGTEPAGNIIGPGYFATDLSLRKNFKIPVREGMGFLVQMDAFNVFNRSNWNNPGTSIGGSLGLITGSAPPRQLQFGAKLNF